MGQDITTRITPIVGEAEPLPAYVPLEPGQAPKTPAYLERAPYVPPIAPPDPPGPPADPPLFLLQASGGYAPNLADGQLLRVPIGAPGQVLTVDSGGNYPTWQNASTGFANPMTAAGDLIDGGTGGTPQRLAIGSPGQVLTVASGAPSWQTPSSGFANPMTAPADLIVGGTGGAPQRLPASSVSGYVLSTQSGFPTTLQWVPNTAGFANPMTTFGDMIYAQPGGTAARLPFGTADGQVLRRANDTLTWGQDMGLAVGGPSTAQPTIFQQPDGSMIVIPLASYSLSGDDAVYINDAFALSPTVHLMPATYTTATTINMPYPTGNLLGHGLETLINFSSATPGASAIYVHNPANPYSYTRLGNRIHGIVIDGSGCSGGTGTTEGQYGLWITQNQHTWLWLAIRNFTSGAAGGNSAGLIIVNATPNNTAINQVYGDVRLEGNDNGCVFAAQSTDQAIEHIYLNLSINTSNQAQATSGNGIVLRNNSSLGDTGGVIVQGSFIKADIRSWLISGPGFIFQQGCVFQVSGFQVRNELDAGAVNSTTAMSVLFTSTTGNCGFMDTWGYLFFSKNYANQLSSPVIGGSPSNGWSNIANINANGGNAVFNHFGPAHETSFIAAMQGPQIDNFYSGWPDQAVITTPAFPTNSAGATNGTGLPVWATINVPSGATLTQGCKVGGVIIGDANTRTWLVPRGVEIFVYWTTTTTAPTWVWQPVG